MCFTFLAAKGYPVGDSICELDQITTCRRLLDSGKPIYLPDDLVGLDAQTHAMLSAATGILRWHEMHKRPEDLAFAESLYKQYRALAMTETFENYNWFNKPISCWW
jgi:3-phosphoglycerate kinase